MVQWIKQEQNVSLFSLAFIKNFVLEEKYEKEINYFSKIKKKKV